MYFQIAKQSVLIYKKTIILKIILGDNLVDQLNKHLF